MHYTVRFKASAKKELSKLDQQIAEKILAAIYHFATGESCDVKKMQGMESNYRIRVNSYRILIEVIVVNHVAYVYRIAHRREVYKKL